MCPSLPQLLSKARSRIFVSTDNELCPTKTTKWCEYSHQNLRIVCIYSKECSDTDYDTRHKYCAEGDVFFPTSWTKRCKLQYLVTNKCLCVPQAVSKHCPRHAAEPSFPPTKKVPNKRHGRMRTHFLNLKNCSPLLQEVFKPCQSHTAQVLCTGLPQFVRQEPREDANHNR